MRIASVLGVLSIFALTLVAAESAAAQSAATKSAPSSTPAKAPVAAAPTPPAYQEKVEDWQLVCIGDGKEKRCSLIKELSDAKAGQRLIALELGLNGDRLEGAAVLPFGVALARGLTVRFKEGEPGNITGFQTCLPAGCVAPVSFDPIAIKQIDQTKTLLFSVGLPSGEIANFTLPAAGIAKAEARLRVVGKSSG